MAPWHTCSNLGKCVRQGKWEIYPDLSRSILGNHPRSATSCPLWELRSFSPPVYPPPLLPPLLRPLIPPLPPLPPAARPCLCALPCRWRADEAHRRWPVVPHRVRHVDSRARLRQPGNEGAHRGHRICEHGNGDLPRRCAKRGGGLTRGLKVALPLRVRNPKTLKP